MSKKLKIAGILCLAAGILIVTAGMRHNAPDEMKQSQTLLSTGFIITMAGAIMFDSSNRKKEKSEWTNEIKKRRGVDDVS